MSTSNSQKLKRNVSPSTNRQGPLRATKPFGLGFVSTSSSSRKHSAKKAPSSPSGKGSRRSLSETGFVTDRRSPTSPSFKVEKPKALHGGHSGSLESISFYLSGQWPKDHTIQGKKLETVKSHHGHFREDVQTQTPDEWDEIDKNRQMLPRFTSYKKPNGEQRGLKPKEIKQKLQRKEIRAAPSSTRYSPVPVFQGIFSQPVRIPTPTSQAIQLRGTPGKQRASVEGHNQEIEKLIVAATSKLKEEEGLLVQVPFETDSYPDGRRAPVYDLLNMRSVDTQTPSQYLHARIPLDSTGARTPLDSTGSQVDNNGESSFLYRPDSRTSNDTDHDTSRPQSVSPSFIGGPTDLEDLIAGLHPLTVESPPVQNSSHSTKPTSPRPNNEFVRLPPDGAEKIKMTDERYVAPRLKHFLTPLTSTVSFQPSERSAFQSLHSLSQTATH